MALRFSGRLSITQVMPSAFLTLTNFCSAAAMARPPDPQWRFIPPSGLLGESNTLVAPALRGLDVDTTMPPLKYCDGRSRPPRGTRVVSPRIPSTSITERTGMSVAEPNDFWSVFSGLPARAGAREAIIEPGRPPLRFADLPGRLEAIRS